MSGRLVIGIFAVLFLWVACYFYYLVCVGVASVRRVTRVNCRVECGYGLACLVTVVRGHPRDGWANFSPTFCYPIIKTSVTSLSSPPPPPPQPLNFLRPCHSLALANLPVADFSFLWGRVANSEIRSKRCWNVDIEVGFVKEYRRLRNLHSYGLR